MKTCIQTFEAGVKTLLEFLNTIEQESKLTSLLLQRQNVLENQEKQLLSKISEVGTNKKQYIYSVTIVSLYGLLERFIDTLIEEFVDRIATLVNSYGEMPEAIQKKHIPMSLELVKVVKEDRYGSLTQETVIANLHSCLSGEKNFRVNGAAFVLHRGNITLDKITEYLTNVGIHPHLRRVTSADEFLKYFQKKEPERNIAKMSDQDWIALLEPINDLVERRNQVSHGVINIDDLESIELLKDRCRFVEVYGGALYNVILQEVLKAQIANGTSVKKLDKPINIYNNSIICFETIVNKPISINDILVAETSNNLCPIFYSPIESLQINNEPLETIPVNNKNTTQFAAKVSFKGTDNYNYYLLEAGTI